MSTSKKGFSPMDIAFSNAVTTRRKHLGITQEELALRANVSPSLITKIERKVHKVGKMSLDNLFSIISALGWSMDSFEMETDIQIPFTPPEVELSGFKLAPACRCGATMRLERFTVPVSPIISSELWQRVQDRFSLGYQVAQRQSPRWDIFPLQGRIKCAECGGVMSGHRSGKNTYYYCRNTLDQTSKRQCEHRTYYRSAEINHIVEDMLKDVLKNDELLEKIMVLPSPKIISYATERQEKEAEKNRYIQLAGKGIIDDETLRSQLERIKKELTELIDPPPAKVQPSDMKQWRKRVKVALDKDLRELVELADAYVLLAKNGTIEISVR